jgi:hypothetical protein
VLPVACRQISRNCSPTLTHTFLFPLPKNKRHSPGKGHASLYASFSVIRCQRSALRSQYTPTHSQQLSLLNKINPTTKTGNYMQITENKVEKEVSELTTGVSSNKLPHLQLTT